MKRRSKMNELNLEEERIKKQADLVENRYCVTNDKFPREVVLLKSDYCMWRQCTFCDYWADGTEDKKILDRVNFKELAKVTGETGVLEVINSGSIFELPVDHIKRIKRIIKDKKIHTLIFESHYLYKDRVDEFSREMGVKVIPKTGLETYDDYFREVVLNKGFSKKLDIDELHRHFRGVNLLVGIKGQTLDMIERDLEIASENMEMVLVNIFTENARDIDIDRDLIKSFYEDLKHLYSKENVVIYDHKNAVGLG